MLAMAHYYAPIPRVKVSIVLQFYIDESGMDPNAPFDFVCVAGFWGQEKEWKAFNRKWARALDRFKLPAFHLTDFLSAANHTKITNKNAKKLKPYIGWSDSEFQKCLDRFICVIEKFGPPGFSWQIRRDDYNAILSDTIREKYTKDPYVLLIDYTYSQFDKRLAWFDPRIRHEKLGLFFGCTTHKLECSVKVRHEIWRDTKFGREHLTSDPLFVLANQSEFFPIQAADILASFSRGHFRGSAYPEVARVGYDEYIKRLFKPKRVLHRLITREQLHAAQRVLEARLERDREAELSCGAF
jgi:hypothetical protein